jgi:hypothetical protein
MPRYLTFAGADAQKAGRGLAARYPFQAIVDMMSNTGL